jgi:hypothetical protein
LLRLFIALGRLVHSFWCADRIRVSRFEGCFQRLSPGALILVDGEAFRVICKRRVLYRDETCLEYHCRGARKEKALRVLPHRRGMPDCVLWRTGDDWVSLHPGRLAVYYQGARFPRPAG